MEKQIKELQQYFIQKILKGEYNAGPYDSHRWVVVIDGRLFSFWTANEDYGFRQDNDFGVNFISLDLTEEERVAIYNIYKERHEDETLARKAEARRKQYEALKSEFESSES